MEKMVSKRATIGALFVVLMVVGAVAACGKDVGAAGTGGGGGVTSVTTSSSSSGSGTTSPCDGFASAVCGWWSKCLGDVEVAATFGNMMTCLSRVSIACTQAVSAKGTSRTDSAFAACGDAIAGASCGGLARSSIVEFLERHDNPFQYAPPLRACRFDLGPLTEGAACRDVWQCESGFCPACQCAPNSGQPGKACISGFECYPDAFCVGDPGNTQCVKGQPTGSPCSGTEPCGDVVGPYLNCLNGVCAIPPAYVEGAEGASCPYPNPYCGPGLLCSKAGLCVKRGQAGDACSGVGTKDTCGAGMRCAATQTCAPLKVLKQGDACVDSATDVICGGLGALCQNGVCVGPIDDGAPCAIPGAGCLWPGACTSGVCALSDPACK